MPSITKSSEEQAIALIAPRKFHQIFTLPATENHDLLKVTYSVLGPPEGEDVPTVVFCGGMFGSRYMIFSDYIAEKHGVRVLCIDRPGFGGSTPVPISQRIPIFLETIPALLTHFNIKHISIVSHSSGTLFALNLLSHRPDLLSPTNPRITLLSPWVNQSISGVSFLQAASMLPNSLLNHWDDTIALMINKASPAFGASSGAITGFSRMFGWGKKIDEEEEERKCMEHFGMELRVKKEAERLVFKYAFEENTKGANDEARLCLKSTEGTGWDAAESYPDLVANLKAVWEEKVRNESAKLKVKIVFAEEDAMIGVKGRKYFEDCWMQERCGDMIEVECGEVKGTDHDSVLDLSKGILEEIFATLSTRVIV